MLDRLPPGENEHSTYAHATWTISNRDSCARGALSLTKHGP